MSNIRTKIIGGDWEIDKHVDPKRWEQDVNEQIKDINSAQIIGIYPIDPKLTPATAAHGRIGFVVFYTV